jgi:hypothetical protein
MEERKVTSGYVFELFYTAEDIVNSDHKFLVYTQLLYAVAAGQNAR